MKKFARCILILILVAILSGVGGYIYENNTMTPMYESVAKLYVVPGSQNEASIRAKNGGLNHDFMIIFSSKVVIESAQRLAGTSEDISEYLTVSSPADSNIVELKVVNPDQNTAKAYVDAVAKTAVKTTTIIPVESMQILSEGTSDGVATKPDLYYYTALIMGAACAVCVFIEIVVCLILCAFKKKEDHSDDEFEYEARFGRYAYPRREYIETEADSTKRIVNDNKRKASSDDILAAFDDDDDDEYDDSFLYQSSNNSNANVAESEKTPEAPVMESEEILEEAVKEAAATKEEYKPEPVVEAEPIQEAAPVVEEPILEKQDEPTLVDEEPAQIVVDTPVEEEQPEEEVKPVEEEQPEEEVTPVEEEHPEEEVKPVEEEQPPGLQGGVGEMGASPVRWATSWETWATGYTAGPLARVASAAASAGTKRASMPAAFAARAMGSIPGTLRTAPERDSSPRKAALGETGGSWPPAERMPTRMGRS